jgi:hypothetical protein
VCTRAAGRSLAQYRADLRWRARSALHVLSRAMPSWSPSLPDRPNPAKLNALQLKTLVILQELARSTGEPQPDGSVVVSRLPRPHGNHFHVGNAVVGVKDATGLGNPAVYGALSRKGLVGQAPDGRLLVLPPALTYDTGIADTVLHRADH